MKNYFCGVLIFFSALFLICAPSSWAVDAQVSPSQEAKLRALHEKLNQLKAMHVKMLEHQSEIKEELESLRVWIRHRP